MILWVLLRLGFIFWNLTPLPIEPPVLLGDLNVFPPRCTAKCNLELSQHFVTWVRNREAIDLRNAALWWEARCEVSTAHEAWGHLHEALDTKCSDDYRRGRLHQLRRLIGPRAYYAGMMPCPAPLWALPRSD